MKSGQRYRKLWSAALALMLGLSALLASPRTTVALSIQEYYSISYDLRLSTTEVNAGDSFNVVVTGSAVCQKNAPLSASSVTVTSRVVAEHQDTGARVTLNASYKVTLSPVPTKPGESVQRTVTVPLNFPAGSAPGTYTIIGEIVDAKATVMGLPVPIAGFLPPSQAIGTVTYHVPGGGVPGGGGGGGGGGGLLQPTPTITVPPAVPGVLDVTGYVSNNGTFLRTASPQSGDGNVRLTISENTTGLLQNAPLQEITVNRITETLPSTADTTIIGVPYRFGPRGAQFVPPAVLTFFYSDNMVPPGVNEADMKIALWDETVDPPAWKTIGPCAVGTQSSDVTAPCVIDPQSNSITITVDHFSVYAILAKTRPAAFVPSDLKISPSEVETGKQVSISAKITNTGDLAGRHEVALVVDGWTMVKKEVILAGGGSAEVFFTTKPDTPGSHAVDVEGLKGAFTAKTPAAPSASPLPPVPASFTVSDLTVTPARVNTGEPVTIRLFVRNTGELPGTYHLDININSAIAFSREIDLDGNTGQEFTWTTVPDTPGSHVVSTGGLAGNFMVSAPPPRIWHIAGAIGGILLLAAAAVFVIALKRRIQTAV